MSKIETEAEEEFAAEPRIEDQILEWRGQEIGKETYEYTVLLCDAEEELRSLRSQVIDMQRPADFEKDKDDLSKMAQGYSDTFMEIVDEADPGNDANRLWKWMAKLTNEAYQIGFKSGRRR